MKHVIEPGARRRQITVVDDLVFGHAVGLDGNPLELKMTLLYAAGNSEMRLVLGRDDEAGGFRQPVIVWINGNGWRAVPCRTYQAAESVYLAEAGYAVAVVDYRDSGKGHFPAQVEDVKTAIRFLRANADSYHLDPDRVGTIGRSAGGHLSSFCALNDDQYRSSEWSSFSDHVQAAVDFYGPVDLWSMHMANVYHGDDPTRTREGLMIGGDAAYIAKMAKAASPIGFISRKMCPVAIFHGDLDPLVPVSQSEHFYEALQKKGIPSELYIVRGAGHGTHEFVQDATRKAVLAFFDTYLRQGEEETCRN